MIEQEPAHVDPSGCVVRLAEPNESLFRTGETKTCLYQVKQGAVCLYERGWDGHRAHIEFAFVGDLVGLGFLKTHARCARALTSTELICLPLDAIESLVEGNPKAQAKLDQAIEREFEHRRRSFVRSDQQDPLARVAAFLLSVSHINADEGRDQWTVNDACPSGAVADLLGLSIDCLANTLVELEKRGMIETCPNGIRLNDLSALEKLASHPTPAKLRKAPAQRPGPKFSVGQTSITSDRSDRVPRLRGLRGREIVCAS
jgi:CRP/FNR family transcriptional regulator